MESTLRIPAEQKRGTLSIRTKLIIGFSLISAFASFITARGIYTNLQRGIIDGFQRRVLSFVQVAALQQNGDDFVKITSPQDPLYEKYRLQNLKIRESDSDIKDVYILREDAHGLYYVVDSSDPDYQALIAFNDRYVLPSALLVANFDTMDKAIVEPEIRTNKNGSYLSAYAPLLAQDGTHVGVIGVDILANSVTQQQRQLFVQSAVIFLIALVLGIFFGYVAGNALTEPVITLARGARAFAAGKLDERVEVNTRDEIGDLAQTFNFMAGEIQELIGGLEERVAQRTKELEGQQRIVLRRSLQFEGINRVARAISSTRNLHETLPQITRLISDQFGFYHVGIFLNDPLNVYTILSAANSEGGRNMLERGHQLKIGEQGIVGNATSTGKPRIALNVGEDAVYFDNPDLPSTRSEMALPLISGNQVIGALDIQSTEANAFSSEDIEVLKTLADQVSLAIQNARLFDQTQKALSEAEAVSRQDLHETWSRLPKERKIFGYKYSITGTRSLEENEIGAQSKSTQREIAVPINLRGEIIGTLAVQVPQNEKISPDQVDLIKAVAERVAISAENARLFDNANRRAERERIISEVTSKIGESVRTENILKTTASELNQLLDGAEVLIKLKTENQESR
jgi:GAF domain-containing protein/HAMP domain-containing protein